MTDEDLPALTWLGEELEGQMPAMIREFRAAYFAQQAEEQRK